MKRHGRCRERPGQKGVSLLEVLVAFVVLAVGVLTIMDIFPTSFAATVRGKHRLIALQLAQKKVEEIADRFKNDATVTYCSSSDPVCCPIMQIVYGTCMPATREIAFPAPFGRYYFRVDSAPVVAPQPQRVIDVNDSWWSTWDSTCYFLEVEVFGPVISPAQLPSSPSAARVKLVTLVSRSAAPLPGQGDRIDAGDPHATGNPRYRIPSQIHLIGPGGPNAVTNPQHPRTAGD